MNWNPLVIVCAVASAVSSPGPSRGDEARPAADRDLAAQVKAVFTARCAVCHGPDVPKPRGEFGYILDLKRLSADADKVVPSKPDESGLWQMVHNGEMPPPDSPTGALSAQDKEVIRAWIAAGAPVDDSSTAPAKQPQSEADQPPPLSPASRALLRLGKFHVLLVHFPIALLVAAAMGELWSMWRRCRVPSSPVRFCLGLAALSAVPLVVLGWLYALGGHGARSPDLLALHRWFGTATAAVAIAAAVLTELDARRGARTWPGRVLLLAAAVLVGVAAHFGGLMVHGRDFLG